MSRQGIHSKRCWLYGRLQEATIFFEDGVITQVDRGAYITDSYVYDAGEAVVMPGIIDIHVHVNEPGRTDWEGFDTATKSAAAGGITTIVDMPLNASPVTTTRKALEEKLQSTKGKLHVNCGFYGGVVPNNINDLEELIQGGVLGIKAFLTHSGIDEFPNVTEADLAIAMPLLAKHDVPLLVHCELSDANQQQELTEHPTNYNAYLNSRPKEWENKAVELMVRLCRKYKCHVHIVHVSSAETLNTIADAKKEGLPITAETCPHYIYFNAEDIPYGETIYKCAPPIRELTNNELLKEALDDGVLDLLATDHSPAPPVLKEIKSGNLQKAWGGIAGLQFLLTASWSALGDDMSLEKFIPLLTEHPARVLNINRKGALKDGYDADIVVWLPEEKIVIKEENILHRHKISPYIGRELVGKIVQTYVNGELVFENSKMTQLNKGKWLLRK